MNHSGYGELEERLKEIATALRVQVSCPACYCDVATVGQMHTNEHEHYDTGPASEDPQGDRDRV